MSLAIRIGRAGQKTSALFYINTVTSYTPLQARAQVSKYPLDAGVSITDHVINENPTCQLSGVISPADISIRTSSLTVDGESPSNTSRLFSTQSEVEIDTMLAGLKQFLPDIANQFISNSNPKLEGGTVAVDESQNLLDKIRTLFTRLTYNSRNKSYSNSVVLCTLYELTASGQKRKDIKNLVLTDFTGRYDPDYGDSLLVEMTFEQVRFTNLQETTVPRAVSANISQSVAIQAKETSDKGREQSALATLTDRGVEATLKLGETFLQ